MKLSVLLSCILYSGVHVHYMCSVVIYSNLCRGNMLAISSEISTPLHLTRLRWIRNTEGGEWGWQLIVLRFMVLLHYLVHSLI